MIAWQPISEAGILSGMNGDGTRPEGPVREADQWRGFWGNREVPPANPGARAPEAEPGRVR
jgi:hypothetical protein